MKKLLVAVIAAAFTLSAVADSHDHKHMITFGGFEDGSSSDTFDISYQDNEGTSSRNIKLNYTYAINNTWQVGLKFQDSKGAQNIQGNAFNGTLEGIGFQAYYNLDHKVMDTCYVGLHYMDMEATIATTSIDITSIALEYGHRFGLGSWQGWHLAFSPSLNVAQIDVDGGNKTTAIGWNWLKFDVLF